MTVDVKAEEAPMAEVAVSQPEELEKEVEHVAKVVEDEGPKGEEEPAKEVDVKNLENGDSSPSSAVQKSASFKEESNILSELKEHEKMALSELRAKIEEAILVNKILKKEEKVEAKEKEDEKPVEEKGDEQPVEENEKTAVVAAEEGEKNDENKEVEVEEKVKEEEKPLEEKEKPVQVSEEKKPEIDGDINNKQEAVIEEKSTEGEKEENPIEGAEESDKKKQLQGEEEEKKQPTESEENKEEIDMDISLWGVPLLPSKGSDKTNVILLKFLRARDFKVNEAFEMLQNTLFWRKQSNIDSILDEDFDSELNSVAYLNGFDREGHPVCYNIYGVFGKEELYSKIFGDEEKRERFLRWRFQMMEKGIEKLDFSPGGTASLLQITDLKSAPGLTKKELRLATKKAVPLLQDNYPEFVALNIFVNVPFWYYALNTILFPFLTQRTKSKMIFSRPANVTETLLKYIPAEDIPVQYGGLKRENDPEFSIENGSVLESMLKAGSTETVEIPVPEVGSTVLWDLTVVGWEVNYKEEFVPTDEGSYTLIIQKEKKLSAQEVPVRNSFRNSEPGKVVLTIENNSSFKKKRVLYRYKLKQG